MNLILDACITCSVVLCVYLRISQILLTFNRLQVMYIVFSFVPLVEAVYKGLIFMQQYSKVQGQALVLGHTQHCFGLILDFKLYCYIILFSSPELFNSVVVALT